MRNNRKRFQTVLVLLLALACLSGCHAGGEESQASSKEALPADYLLTFRTQGGMALSDVLVKVYEDSSLSDLVFAAMTDGEGVFRFTAAESDSYVAVVYPEKPGYTAEAYYPVTGKDTVMTVKTAPYQVEDLSDLSLKAGDVMPDLKITCTDGSVLSIAELLEAKKAVVLNFWFIGCNPCRMEFPYLQQAYEGYSDRLEVIAINPYDGTDTTVSAYAEEMGLTFPVASEDSYWQTAMNLRAYPTTVVIDRYGVISLVHVGAITDTETFRSIFAEVTADDYLQN